MNKKKIIVNIITILLLSFLTIFYLKKASILSIQTLLSIKIEDYLIVLLWVYFCYFFISFVEKLVYSTFCIYPIATALKTTLLGALGSAVSPLKSAHFPLKVYAQSNSGLALNQTLTGITKCQIIFSLTSIIVYAILSIIFAILGIKETIQGITFPLFLTTTIGFATNLFVFVFLLVLSKNHRLQNTTLLCAYYLLKVFKRSLKKEDFISKKTQRLILFQEQTKAVFNNLKSIILPSILYAFYMIISSLSPYICYLTITQNSFNFYTCINFYLLSLSAIYLTNIIPVPGGCIVAEYIFSVVFASVLGEQLSQILLLWRVCTYYLPIIINFIIFIICSLKIKTKPIKT